MSMKSQIKQNQALSSPEAFSQQLQEYKDSIDHRIDEYVDESVAATKKAFGYFSTKAFAAYTSILQRGGKRIRGALTMESYRMFGGQDTQVATQAALVMEMVQAYLLIIDDVCDRSSVRRGGPTAHVMMADAHRLNGWSDEPGHFGESIAMLAGVLGMHEALIEADKIPAPHATRLAAIRNLNYCLSVTAHGQFNDIYNQVAGVDGLQNIEDVMVWKTAFYTFVNPLQFGAILADAPADALQTLVDYSLQMGKAFQLSDDIIGVFVDEEVSGKSPLDDIREGKQTLQIELSLQKAEASEVAFLKSVLGSAGVTMDDVMRCREIITSCGAYDEVQRELNESLSRARRYTEDIAKHADKDGVAFLLGLVDYLEHRTN